MCSLNTVSSPTTSRWPSGAGDCLFPLSFLLLHSCHPDPGLPRLTPELLCQGTWPTAFFSSAAYSHLPVGRIFLKHLSPCPVTTDSQMANNYSSSTFMGVERLPQMRREVRRAARQASSFGSFAGSSRWAAAQWGAGPGLD